MENGNEHMKIVDSKTHLSMNKSTGVIQNVVEELCGELHTSLVMLSNLESFFLWQGMPDGCRPGRHMYNYNYIYMYMYHTLMQFIHLHVHVHVHLLILSFLTMSEFHHVPAAPNLIHVLPPLEMVNHLEREREREGGGEEGESHKEDTVIESHIHSTTSVPRSPFASEL